MILLNLNGSSHMCSLNNFFINILHETFSYYPCIGVEGRQGLTQFSQRQGLTQFSQRLHLKLFHLSLNPRLSLRPKFWLRFKQVLY